MHKLMEYICSEMEELERKADKEGKLSMAEVQYLDTLAHTKKNLLKADEMWEESEYSEAMDGGRGTSYARRSYAYARDGRGGNRSNAYDGSYDSYEDGSMAMARGRGRNARRDSMGRYSRAEGTEMMVGELRELMQDAPDERTKMEFKKFIEKIEQI